MELVLIVVSVAVVLGLFGLTQLERPDRPESLFLTVKGHSTPIPGA